MYSIVKLANQIKMRASKIEDEEKEAAAEKLASNPHTLLKKVPI